MIHSDLTIARPPIQLPDVSTSQVLRYSTILLSSPSKLLSRQAAELPLVHHHHQYHHHHALHADQLRKVSLPSTSRKDSTHRTGAILLIEQA